jgi:hypothetical protein
VTIEQNHLKQRKFVSIRVHWWFFDFHFALLAKAEKDRPNDHPISWRNPMTLRSAFVATMLALLVAGTTLGADKLRALIIDGQNNHPMLMTIRYGKGRVFHTAIGHAGKQLKSVAFIVTFQRGTEWAATGKVTQDEPDDFPGPDEPRVRE